MSQWWSVQDENYHQTSGWGFSAGPRGVIDLRDSSGEALSIPFVWWIPSQSYNTTFNWWDGYQSNSGSSLPNQELNSVRFIRFRNYLDSSNFYFFLLPVLDENPLVELSSSTYLQSRLNNPTVDISLFGKIFNSEYDVLQVRAADVGLEDILNFQVTQSSETQSQVPVNSPSNEVPDSTSVPEPNSPLSLVVLGTLFLGYLLKRRLTQAHALTPKPRL